MAQLMLLNTEHQAPATGVNTDSLSSQQPACCVSATAAATSSYRSLPSPWTVPAGCQQDQQQQTLSPKSNVQPCTHMTWANLAPQQQQVQQQEHSSQGVSPQMQPLWHEELMPDAPAVGRISEPSSALRKQQQQSLTQKRQRPASLLVMAQLLRLLMALCADQHTPASAATGHALSRASVRAQLFKEFKTAAAAAAAATAGSERVDDPAALLQHLPAARLQQVCSAAKQRPVCFKGFTLERSSCGAGGAHAGTCSNNNSSCGSDVGTSSSDAHALGAVADPDAGSDPAVLSPACVQHIEVAANQQQRLLVQHSHAQQQQQQQQQQDGASAARAHSVHASVLAPSQPIVWEVGCLLETTLVAAAAEAQLNSVSWEAPGSDCLADDASSAVDIEGVMLEEFELAKLNGIL